MLQPKPYTFIAEATSASGFTMASDPLTCSLLRTLAVTRPAGKFLELGTGTGLSSAWILDGMDQRSTLISVDNDPIFLTIAQAYLGEDRRLSLVNSDGGDWITAHQNDRYDYIFADTWHGKYLLLDETLEMLAPGGLYIIDDLLPQPNWPEGHQEKVVKLINYLGTREDLSLTQLDWSTGLIIAAKK